MKSALASPFRRLRSEAGQAAVEFAGVMIPFTLLFLAIVDGGMLFVGWINNTNAVREGARCGVVGGSTANIQAKVGQPTGATGPATVTRTDSDDAGTTLDAGDTIAVSLEWEYEWISPVQLFGFSKSMTRTSASTMRLETDDFTKTCPGVGSG